MAGGAGPCVGAGWVAKQANMQDAHKENAVMSHIDGE